MDARIAWNWRGLRKFLCGGVQIDSLLPASYTEISRAMKRGVVLIT